MLFKLSQATRFNALILFSIFGVCGLSSCTEGSSDRIELNFISSRSCSNFNFTYSDRLDSYRCNGSENYSGNTNKSNYEVAGVCTTTVTNLNQPNLGMYYQQDQILIDCVSGALTSFDSTVHIGGVSPSKLFINRNANLNVFFLANMNDKLSVNVRCDVHGAERDSETLIYTLTALGSAVFHCA